MFEALLIYYKSFYENNCKRKKAKIYYYYFGYFLFLDNNKECPSHEILVKVKKKKIKFIIMATPKVMRTWGDFFFVVVC